MISTLTYVTQPFSEHSGVLSGLPQLQLNPNVYCSIHLTIVF